MLSGNDMTIELTEEEMRQALFGELEVRALVIAPRVQHTALNIVTTEPENTAKKKKSSHKFTPRLRVTLRVGNEFEGKMHEVVHEADTLSSLVAEQEAARAARKKFRFVEVVSVKST